jgi:ubiquinone/menaquinone biosynthesis C-methylase UbiE
VRRVPRIRRPSFLARAQRDMAATPSLGQDHERSEWFWSHYRDAADATIRILAEAGLDLRGRRVADVGCGEGITDLALVLKGEPAELVGYDINPADTSRLLDEARREGVADDLPAELRFELSEPTELPASDDAFDLVLSWSAFEHVGDPSALMREIARVLRPDGVFVLQLWPFYHSEHGSHLWQWFPEGFAQFRYSHGDIERRVREHDSNSAFAEMMLGEFSRLNKVTLDDLGTAIRAAGMRVARLEPISGPVNVPPDAADVPLSSLAISGVMLLAVHA